MITETGILLELQHEFLTIMSHSDSDDFYVSMYDSTVSVVARAGITIEDFVDEDEYNAFIENVLDQSEDSVKMTFQPTLSLVGLVDDITDKLRRRVNV